MIAMVKLDRLHVGSVDSDVVELQQGSNPLSCVVSASAIRSSAELTMELKLFELKHSLGIVVMALPVFDIPDHHGRIFVVFTLLCIASAHQLLFLLFSFAT